MPTPCPTSAAELARLHRENATAQRELEAVYEAHAAEARARGDRYTEGVEHGMALGMRLTADYLDAVAAELERLALAN